MPRSPQGVDPSMSASNPRMLVALLEELGHSKQKILADTRITAEQLRDYRNVVRNSQYRRLILNALEITGNPALGLIYGTRINYTGHNILGFGLLASETFWQALNFLKIAAIVVEPAVDNIISRDNDLVHISIEEAVPWEGTHRFMIDTGISVFHSWVSLFDPKVSSQMRYFVDYPEPSNSEIYKEYITGEITFNSPIRRISIPASFCDQPLPLHNRAACKQAQDELENLLTHIQDPAQALLMNIKQIISREPGIFPTIEQVADTLHVTPRTLSRRLSATNTTFKDIAVNVRKQRAVEYLYNNKLSIDEIANELGYSDPSNFSKAFRKWTGLTPSQYRAKFSSDNDASSLKKD